MKPGENRDGGHLPYQGPHRIQRDEQGRCLCSGLTFREVEDLLDWLEGRGITQREVLLEPGGAATVRWVP